MRRLLVIITLAIALPAAAQQPKPADKPAPPPISKPLPTGPSADQCRAACAQRYYFCIAEAEIETCSPAWAQCRNKCLPS